MDDPQLRAALLDQLRYLLYEVTAMEPMVDRLHEGELGRRTRGPSVKECYGALIAWDQKHVLPELERLTGMPVSNTDNAKADWNLLPLRRILSDVNKVRRTVVRLVALLSAAKWTMRVDLDDGTCDVYGLIHRTIQHDAAMLRTVAEHLNEGW